MPIKAHLLVVVVKVKRKEVQFGLPLSQLALKLVDVVQLRKYNVRHLHTRIDWPPPLPRKFTRFPGGKTGLEMATRLVIASRHEVKYRDFV